MKKVICTLLLVLSPIIAFADLDVSTYQKLIKGTKLEKGMAESYVGGVGKGYFWANASLNQDGKPLLFCFDGDMKTEDFNALVSPVVASIQKTKPKTPIELVLLMKLKEIHPCQ